MYTLFIWPRALDGLHNNSIIVISTFLVSVVICTKKLELRTLLWKTNNDNKKQVETIYLLMKTLSSLFNIAFLVGLYKNNNAERVWERVDDVLVSSYF